MDFQELLSQADYNTAEANYSRGASKYSAELPPPKKVPKSNVMSDNIRRFLEKRKAEEAAKVAEARKQREELLAIRAQNSKNNKKAKLMVSRTKDNDFSRIRLSEDEIASKKKVEAELIRKNLADKVERMKARIEMEEKEKLLPKKRKRKSKNKEPVEDSNDHFEEDHNRHETLNGSMKGKSSIEPQKNKVHKSKAPPPPSLSFNDLLQLAAKKQHEPLKLDVQKKEEMRLMTKKERKLREEEIAREKRKQERLLKGESGLSKSNPVQSSTMTKKKDSDKVDSKKPVVIHVNKDNSKPNSALFKIPKSSVNIPANKTVPTKHKEGYSNPKLSNSNSKLNNSNPNSKLINSNPNSLSKPTKSPHIDDQKRLNIREEREAELRHKIAAAKKNGLKINPNQAASNKTPKLDEAALKASLEKEIREKLEKEMEEKIAAKFAQFQAKANEKAPEPPKQIKKEPEIGSNSKKKVIEKSAINSKKDIEAMKRQAMLQKQMKSKLPQRKPFHMNPYLDPPRRLLEPQRPPRPPMKRRIESDDDDDDDDDMDDFIVDSSQNEEDYSKYIKEIFNYDRNKYVDDDGDEVMESSFLDQMKEETRSARLGYLEDLEEERLERLEQQRKKKKKVKK